MCIRVPTLVLLCSLTAARLASSDSPSDVAALMELSGLSAQIGRFGPIFHERFKVDDSTRGEERRLGKEVVLAALDEAFSVEKLEASSRDYLAQDLNPADVAAVLAWLQSPLGRKITRLDVEALTIENYELRQKQGPKLFSDLTDDRRTAILALVASQDAPARVARLAVDLGIAVASAVGQVNKSYDTARFAAHVAELRSQEPVLRQAMQREIPISFCFAYREVSDDELTTFLQFSESPLGRRYSQATSAAVDEAMKAAALRFASLIAKRITE